MIKTMFLMYCACIGRASLFTRFCPLVEDIELSEEMDVDGYPQWIVLMIRYWKGNADGKRRPQRLKIFRNYIDVRFCPIVNLFLWLKLYDITSGPIFPACNSLFTAIQKDAHGNTFFNTPGWWENQLKKLFVFTGGQLIACTSHSIRKSCTIWAIRSGYESLFIRLVGRWSSTSDSFMEYVQQGIDEKADMFNSGATDPIYLIWVFQTHHYKGVLSQDILIEKPTGGKRKNRND